MKKLKTKTKNKILIVESDLFDRDVLSKLLSDTCAITFMQTVADALAFPAIQSQDTIVLDVKFPELEPLRSIKEAKTRWPYNIPLILIVSNNSFKFELFARSIGIFYYLLKPFDFKELYDIINSASRFAIDKRGVYQRSLVS